jgi:hypothetical protein
MDDETKARFDALDARFDALMTRMNDQFERVLDRLSDNTHDLQNTKGFLLEDAIILGRRMHAVEQRLDDLERKP